MPIFVSTQANERSLSSMYTTFRVKRLARTNLHIIYRSANILSDHLISSDQTNIASKTNVQSIAKSFYCTSQTLER